jgi:hypothetical protein
LQATSVLIQVKILANFGFLGLQLNIRMKFTQVDQHQRYAHDIHLSKDEKTSTYFHSIAKL